LLYWWLALLLGCVGNTGRLGWDVGMRRRVGWYLKLEAGAQRLEVELDMDVLRNSLIEGLKVGFVGKVKGGFQRSEVGRCVEEGGSCG
jgi:hypothetical protein